MWDHVHHNALRSRLRLKPFLIEMMRLSQPFPRPSSPVSPDPRPRGTGIVTPPAKNGSLMSVPGQQPTNSAPLRDILLANSNLAPRMKLLLTKPHGQLSLKERRIVMDYMSEQRLRRAGIPDIRALNL